ncbi:MAG: toprim domain-containing protein [Clostridia bacterium]|jgi:DNA primase|nr:toprim domain-containing protein [Clostridia bacterium]
MADMKELLEYIADLRRALPLKDLLKEELDAIGIGDMTIGYCPFEDVDRGSYLDRHFIVTDSVYFCTKCGESGDVFDYVMKRDGVSFDEAVSILAEKTGKPVPVIDGGIEGVIHMNEHKERLYSMMREAALHYMNNLKDARSKIAVDYLEKRGFENVIVKKEDGTRTIANPTVRNFAFGYSLDYDSLIKHLSKKGYTLDEMKEGGLVYDKNGSPYDVMRGRLIIPIINRYNKVIAMSGRIFEAKGFTKYRNTGDTVIFNKRNELYGAYNLRAQRGDGKLSEVYVVEGYMDVIAMYKAGIKNVVASMGTALTGEQVKILKDYTDNVYLMYDGDSAGQNAIKRGMDILYEGGVTPYAITLIEGLDPDEIIAKYGVEKILELKENAFDIARYKIEKLAEEYDLEEVGDRGDYSVKVIDTILNYVNKVEAESYLSVIAEKTSLSAEVLRNQLYESKMSQKSDTVSEKSGHIDTYGKAIIYILYLMLRSRKVLNVSYYLNNDDERAVYDYLRLVKGEGDMETLSGMESNAVAKEITLMKGMTADEMAAFGRDSLKRIRTIRAEEMSKDCFKEFVNAGKDVEAKYMLNENISNMKEILKKLKS